ncbi:unnamed protein product [Miscanthus lutarioriparius]|uniref:Uncharacterized protein n=1 Tax=Miscanthus lutarioriparius TaxID=422564 RepID=A0A811MHC8_9POAL|nr:unnamed protein product [Miscanthus lutarioriparius]
MGEAVTAAELLYGMPLIRSVTGDGGGGVETGGWGALLVELKQPWGEIGKSLEERERMVGSWRPSACACTAARSTRPPASGPCCTSRSPRGGRDRRALQRQQPSAQATVVWSIIPANTNNEVQILDIDTVNKWTMSLTERVSSATTLLEELRAVKAERSRQFADIRSEIEKITAEIAGRSYGGYEGSPRASVVVEEHDLTIRRLNEYKARLTSLQKEKSDRLHRVLEHVTEVHSLRDVLGEDFIAIVNEVPPGAAPGRDLREAVVPLVELWELMDSSEERRGFRKVTAVLNPDKVDALSSGVLSVATIKKTEEEVERLTIKAGRMKELVLKRRPELENICRSMHVEPDASTVPEKSIALIDSGLVNPSELMASIDEQIAKAREELQSRREIMEKINKWLLACEEEKWLEEYNMEENRFSTGRIARLNLKRAEKARLIITKIPAVVDNLISRNTRMGERKKEAVPVRQGSLGCRLAGAQASQAQAGGGEEATQGAQEAAHPAEREGGDAAPEAARQQLRQGGRALQREPETGRREQVRVLRAVRAQRGLQQQQQWRCECNGAHQAALLGGGRGTVRRVLQGREAALGAGAQLRQQHVLVAGSVLNSQVETARVGK